MTKEQKFFKALQDVFIGTKIEGKGGFISLMKIKANYYSKIEDILKKDIEEALKNTLHSEMNFLTNSIPFLAGISLKAVQFISIQHHFTTIHTKRFIQMKKKGDCSKYSTYVIIYSGGGNYELSRARRNSIL